MAIPRTRYPEVVPYLTKDGSEIRELMHPEHQGNRAQSLAEATVPPGSATRPHYHRRSEEIYHVTAGRGWMSVGTERFEIGPGDTVCIPPGESHWVENDGTAPLHILCACSPAYSHEDTVLVDTA